MSSKPSEDGAPEDIDDDLDDLEIGDIDLDEDDEDEEDVDSPQEMSREMAELFGEVLPPPVTGDPIAPSRMGRPAGSKNRPKDAVMTADKLESLYTRIEPILTADHKKYLKEVITGKKPMDPLRELELLLRYGSLLITEAFEASLQQKNYSNQNLSKLMGELRMGLKDLEDMTRRRRDEAEKNKTNDELGMVDPLRQSTVARFQGLHGIDPSAGS